MPPKSIFTIPIKIMGYLLILISVGAGIFGLLAGWVALAVAARDCLLPKCGDQELLPLFASFSRLPISGFSLFFIPGWLLTGRKFQGRFWKSLAALIWLGSLLFALKLSGILPQQEQWPPKQDKTQERPMIPYREPPYPERLPTARH